MGALTPAHLVLILIIALIVVGPGKLPEVGAAIGKSLKEFKKASGDITDNLVGTASQSAPPAQPVQQVAYQPVQPVAYQAPYQPAGGAIVPPPGQVAYQAPVQYYQPQPDPAAGFVAQPGFMAQPGQVAYPAPAPLASAPLASAPDAYQPVTGVVVEPPSGPKAG